MFQLSAKKSLCKTGSFQQSYTWKFESALTCARYYMRFSYWTLKSVAGKIIHHPKNKFLRYVHSSLVFFKMLSTLHSLHKISKFFTFSVIAADTKTENWEKQEIFFLGRIVVLVFISKTHRNDGCPASTCYYILFNELFTDCFDSYKVAKDHGIIQVSYDFHVRLRDFLRIYRFTYTTGRWKKTFF